MSPLKEYKKRKEKLIIDNSVHLTSFYAIAFISKTTNQIASYQRNEEKRRSEGRKRFAYACKFKLELENTVMQKAENLNSMEKTMCIVIVTI
jgi:hypothetical protein